MATKKKTDEGVDPAFQACFDLALLDYDTLARKVEGKHLRLKHHNDHRRLIREGKWNAEWLMLSYTAVCSKVSSLPRSMRDFVEYLGDNATVLWIQSEAKAREALEKNEKEEDEK